MANDLFALLAGDDPGAEARAEALARAMRQRQNLGILGQLSGDRVIAPVGGGIAREAAEGPGQIAQVMNQRQGRLLSRQQMAQQQANADRDFGLSQRRLGLEESRITQDAWGAVADPVTGGIVMFNRKTGDVRPLGPGGGQPGPVAGGEPRPNIPGKPTEDQRKKVAAANQSITQIDLAIGALDQAPGAYGGLGNFMAGLADQAGGTPVQSLTSRRLDPTEITARNFVSNVVSKIINDRAGANVTLREELRQRFLPQETDSLDVVKRKLSDLKTMEAVAYETQGAGFVPPVSSGQSAGEALQQAPIRKFTRDASGKLVEVK